MKITAALLAIAAIACVATIAQAVDQADRPAGIGEKDWIQISERLGFVLDQPGIQPGANQSRQVLIAPPDRVSAELLPPAKGYFVVKTPGGWQRIVISE
jgi:hypothetical protein